MRDRHSFCLLATAPILSLEWVRRIVRISISIQPMTTADRSSGGFAALRPQPPRRPQTRFHVVAVSARVVKPPVAPGVRYSFHFRRRSRPFSSRPGRGFPSVRVERFGGVSDCDRFLCRLPPRRGRGERSRLSRICLRFSRAIGMPARKSATPTRGKK